MKVLIGLGNPGKEYKNTRHNVGFQALDRISDEWNIDIKRGKWDGIYGEGHFKGEKVILLKPLTYMNESGRCIKQVVDYFHLDPEDLLIFFDDKDIPLGTVRLRKQGSAGSHNGMKSVIYHLQTQEIPRVKIAIGKQPEYMRLRDYVMSKMGEEDRKIIDEEIQLALLAAEIFVTEGMDMAMNKVNPLGKKEE